MNAFTHRGMPAPPAPELSMSTCFTIHTVSVKTQRILRFGYTRPVPKLWSDTIDDHRRAVRDAILEATGRLVAKQGLVSLRMSHVAESTGIGRATLYKYFPDV